MVRFEKDQLIIAIPTSSPATTYFDTMRALHRLYSVAAESDEHDEAIKESVAVLSYWIGTSMSSVDSKMIVHIERNLSTNTLLETSTLLHNQSQDSHEVLPN